MFRPWVCWWCWTDCYIACISAGGTGTVSHAKTEFIVAAVGASADDKAVLIVADQSVQCVSSFVYLGCAILPDARIAGEVDRRLTKAANAFGSLQCVSGTQNSRYRSRRCCMPAVSRLSFCMALNAGRCWSVMTPGWMLSAISVCELSWCVSSSSTVGALDLLSSGEYWEMQSWCLT